MVLSINKVKFWTYLNGNFLYRVHWVRLRKVIKLLIAIVLGALLLAGLYTLFEDVVMPRLEKEVEDMFDYNGSEVG